MGDGMLKKLLLKGKAVPVPVPVFNLQEALLWIDSTLILPGHLLTKVELNGLDITDRLASAEIRSLALDGNTQLEIKIESPRDLALQTLDSMHTLCRCIYDSLQPVAIKCWQSSAKKAPKQLLVITHDVDLVISLADHLIHLIDASREEAAAVRALVGLVGRAKTQLAQAMAANKWSESSTILLNRMEPLLKELVKESENLQLQVFSLNSRLHKELSEVGA